MEGACRKEAEEGIELLNEECEVFQACEGKEGKNDAEQHDRGASISFDQNGGAPTDGDEESQEPEKAEINPAKKDDVYK